jgi:hypothetical protein
MKNIFKLLTVILITSIFTARAQVKPTTPLVSLGPEIGIPVGMASDVYSLVAGASLNVQLPLAKSPFSVMLSAGYNSFLVKGAYTSALRDAAYIPVEAGGRLYVTKILYLEGDLGASFNINSNYSGPATAFVYSPVLGISTPLKKRGDALDFGFKYEGRVEPGGTVAQVAFRIGYRFAATNKAYQ